MPGTYTTAWFEAMSKSDVELVFFVAITIGSTTYNVLSAPCDAYSHDIGIDAIGGFGKSHNPVTRRTTIDNLDITATDAWARSIVVGERVRGAKVVVKVGTRAMGSSDYRTRFVGLIEDFEVLPGKGGVVFRCLDALTYALSKNTKRQWVNEHPLTIAKDLLTDAGVPSSLINSSSFTPSNYTSTISHWVIDEEQVERFSLVAPYDVQDPISPGQRLRQWDDMQSDPKPAISQLESIMQILPGMIIVGDDGVVRFKEYNDAASVDVHFASVADVSVLDIYDNQANEVTISVGLNGREAEYKAEDATSKAAFAYPGESSRTFSRDISTGWLGGCSLMQASISAAATSIGLMGLRLFGFCGTRVPSGWPATSQASDAQLSGSRPAYWLIADPNGLEIVKATALTIDASIRGSLQVFDGSWFAPTNQVVPVWLSGTVTRAQLGTSAAAHDPYDQYTESDGTIDAHRIIYDVTIPVAMADYQLKRFTYGCPVVRFLTPSPAADIYEIGDFCTLDADEFASYGIDGLDSSSKFEIIGKRFDPFGGESSGVEFMAAFVGTVAPTVTTTMSIPGHIMNGIRRAVDAARIIDAIKAFIGHGLDISAGTGLVVDVAPGGSSNRYGQHLARVAQNISVRASRDSYLSIDTMTGAIIVRDVTTGAGDPGTNPHEARIGWAQVGASSVSAVTATKEDRAVHIGRIDSPTVIATVSGTQYVPKGGTWSTLVFNSESLDTAGSYNPSTYTFTAPSAGIYSMHARVLATSVEAGKYVGLRLYKNGTTIVGYSGLDYNDSGVSRDQPTDLICDNLQLASGDTVVLQGITDNAASPTITVGDAYSVFEIRRVR